MGAFWSGPEVKSLSLEEILAERPSRLSRFARVAKIGLMAWGGLCLAALAGTATYHLVGSGDPVLVTRQKPAPMRADMLTEIPDATSVAQAGSFTQPQSASADTGPIVEARLPRPRPDEPAATGSIGPPAYDPTYAPRERRQVDPCEALRRMGVPFRLRIRCDTEARYYAPPHRTHYYAAPPEPAYAPAPPPPAPRPYYPPRY